MRRGDFRLPTFLLISIHHRVQSNVIQKKAFRLLIVCVYTTWGGRMLPFILTGMFPGSLNFCFLFSL